MKALQVAGKILIGIAAAIVLFLVVLYICVTASFFEFFSHSRGEFVIPGLNTPFVPQGFEYVSGQNLYLICGYMSDESASRVYVRDEAGDTFCSELLNADGSAYLGHAGGVCYNGDFVYIAGDNGLDVFLLSDILSGQPSRMQGTVITGYSMAYCSFYNGYLLAGNFYYPETYETPANHHIVTPAGDSNTGLITVFAMDSTETFGVKPTPVAAFSTSGRVQGMCFSDEGTIVLSTSYGFAPSELTFYSVDTLRKSSMDVRGQQVPIYYLDHANQIDQVRLPPMSEEIIHRNGRIYVLCESACSKYVFGRFIRGYQVFSYDYQD